MKIMKRALLDMLILLPRTFHGQKRQIYSLDFDYKRLMPKDTFASTANLPNYYVLTTYFDNVLTDIDLFQKENWMKKPLQTHAKVETKGKMIFFVYDAGKARVGGYGKVLSHKIRFTDTAMLM